MFTALRCAAERELRAVGNAPVRLRYLRTCAVGSGQPNMRIDSRARPVIDISHRLYQCALFTTNYSQSTHREMQIARAFAPRDSLRGEIYAEVTPRTELISLRLYAGSRYIITHKQGR